MSMSTYPVTGIPTDTPSGDSDGPAESGKLNIGFFKMLGAGGSRKTTRDGQPAKRRGPKPDSKPALTRRQELNRQAQRTHRERKEQYIRSLEAEYSRLREVHVQELTNAQQQNKQQSEEIQMLRTENDYLKQLLVAHNIPFEAEINRAKAMLAGRKPSTCATDAYTTTSTMASHSTKSHSQHVFVTTPPSSLNSPVSPPSAGEQHGTRGDQYTPFPSSRYHSSPTGHSGLDFSSKGDNVGTVSPYPGIFEKDPQLGIDFILTLEAPCRDHTEYLCRESYKDVENESFFSGHALMASCPPPSHIEHVPEGNQYPHQTYDLPTPDLEKLLNLSKQLITDGQITPIMILQSLKNHEQYHTLTKEDIKTIIDTLNAKVRCYGFGAVVEDFELRDCLQGVLGAKLQNSRAVPSRCPDDAVMYG